LTFAFGVLSFPVTNPKPERKNSNAKRQKDDFDPDFDFDLDLKPKKLVFPEKTCMMRPSASTLPMKTAAGG
jgi:hypothetical protein